MKDLISALKVARLFIITAHDYEQPYVKKILTVDGALASAALADPSTEQEREASA